MNKQSPETISISDIQQASARIAAFIKQTPVLQSSLLNNWLGGHRILFKAECLQTTGAFKLRGALNTLLTLQERGQLPKRVICNSSGNHAQAVAYAASKVGVPCTVYCPKSISSVKKQATEAYGAEIKLFGSRIEADKAVKQQAAEEDVFWLPPYNHPAVIAGQGTLLLDTLQQVPEYDGVFAPCGGGGLLAGSSIVHQHFHPDRQIIGAEPAVADDAYRSLAAGEIISLSESPTTLADGAATISVGHHTFPWLQQLDDLQTVSEQQIAYWTQWLHHLLKLHIEPTCAMTMEVVRRWLSQQTEPKTALVLISGGNISAASMAKVWQHDHLTRLPSL